MQTSALPVHCGLVRIPGQAFVGQQISARRLVRCQSRDLRCFSSGRSEQNGFDFLNWGAKLIKRLGGTGTKRSPQKSDQLVNGEAVSPQEEPPSGINGLTEAAVASTDPVATDESEEKKEEEEEEGSGESPITYRRRAYRHLSRAGEITEDWPPSGTPTWEDWLEEFDATLESETDLNELYQNIAAAVQEEDYERATALRGTLEEWAAEDELSGIIEAYHDALQSEDFEAAAGLRDYGGIGLCGWWWPHSSSAGTPNHILRVFPAWNRYVFMAYDPSDLAQIHGIALSSSQQELTETAEYNPTPSKQDFHDHGVPLLELLYRRTEEPTGGPNKFRELVAQACALRFEPEENSPGDEAEDVVSTSDSESASNDEGEQVIKMEGVELGGWSGSDKSLPVMSVSVESPDADGDGESSFLAYSSTGDDQEPFTALQVPDSLPLLKSPGIQRVPAAIQKFENDRNRFLVHVFPSEEEEVASREAAESSWQLEGSDEEPEVEIVRLSDNPEKQALLDKLQSKAKDLGVDLKSRVSVEVKIKGNLDNSKKLDLKVLADEIVKGTGKVWESGAVADVLKKALEKVTKQMPFTLVDTDVLRGSVSYKRIPIDSPTTDPFTGIYIGAFGHHGLEVLQLQRAIGEDGKEYCEGTKLTGDENVPAGHVSFRAAIGMQQRVSAFGYYPPELNVTARYKGQGRVAEAGYKNASWVDGELLQFGSGPNEFLKGAQLGFLWNFGGAQSRHLSLLHRLSLDNPLEDALKAAYELPNKANGS